MAQEMGKNSRLLSTAHGQQSICAGQFAVLSLQNRAGGLCSIKLIKSVPRVSEISSFSSSLGKPLSPGPEQDAYGQVSGPIISMREMSLLLQPFSRHKGISSLDVYCHSSSFTLLYPFPQAVQERKKKKPVTLLKVSASPAANYILLRMYSLCRLKVSCTILQDRRKPSLLQAKMYLGVQGSPENLQLITALK